jgi:membrane fusion protein, multidrug efflux system
MALTNEVLKAMFWHKLKTSVAIAAALVGLLLAGGGLAIHLRADAGAKAPPVAADEKARTSKRETAVAPQDAGPGLRAVAVSQPVRRHVAPYQEFTGTLVARQTVEVRARVSGGLENVTFKPGSEVQKGDLLFEIDPTVYRLAFDKARAELAAAEARRKHGESEVKRARQLMNNNAIGQEDFDKIVADAATTEAAAKSAQVDVDRARLNLDATKVTAPIAGQIGRPQVDLGNLVHGEGEHPTLLATITALNPIRLSFEIDQNSFLRYRRLLRQGEVIGSGSSLTINVSSGEEHVSREGRLEDVDVQVSPRGTVGVRGVFPNADKVLLPGMFVGVRMPFGKARPVLQVPTDALLEKDDHAYVLVVNDRDVLEKRTVKKGQGDEDLTVIEEGLGAGDWVVVEGLSGLRAGDQVIPRRTPIKQDPPSTKK